LCSCVPVFFHAWVSNAPDFASFSFQAISYGYAYG
jgi:hypothetical protein